MIRRRQFITLLGGAVAAWPLAVQAQQSTPVIGYLYLGSPEPIANRLAAFRKGLMETGFIEGRNLAIEYRWAHNELGDLQVAPDRVGTDHVRVRVRGLSFFERGHFGGGVVLVGVIGDVHVGARLRHNSAEALRRCCIGLEARPRMLEIEPGAAPFGRQDARGRYRALARASRSCRACGPA